MCELRAKKVDNIKNDIPDLEVVGEESDDLLVLGWGGTNGAITEAVNRSRANGLKVSQANLKYLNPMPKNTEAVLKKYKKVLVPELNLGQLSKLVRERFLLNVETLNKVQGMPFKSIEIQNKISEILGGKNGN